MLLCCSNSFTQSRWQNRKKYLEIILFGLINAIFYGAIIITTGERERGNKLAVWKCAALNKNANDNDLKWKSRWNS